MTADRTAGIARSGIARHRAPQRGLSGLMRDIASSASARISSARSRRLDLLLRPPLQAWTLTHMNRLRPTAPVPRGGPARPLPDAHRSLDVGYTVDGARFRLADLHRRTGTTSFVVLHRGAVVHEQYRGRFAGPSARFLLFSLTKSVTSMLIGIAIDEGAIAGVDDPVVKYLPDLHGSVYDGPTIAHLLDMSSGAGAGEDWTDPDSTVVRFKRAIDGDGSVRDVIASLPRTAIAGSTFNYSSIDAQVLGCVLEAATGTPLPRYTAERLWQRIGAEHDAYFWLTFPRPRSAVAAGSFAATARDVARLGLLMARAGRVQGEQAVPAAWVARSRGGDAGHLRVGALGPSGYPHYGYANQWWTLGGPRRAFTGLGIYGQYLYVDPEADVVIVKTSAWPAPDDPGRDRETVTALQAVADHLASSS
jgi:CubicO group peptidase (beta-lactamase class C family)